jgi:ABC-type multidrug transport system fused ATPase/permease subunit
MGPLLQIIQAPLGMKHDWSTILGSFWGPIVNRSWHHVDLTGYDLLRLIPLALIICVTFKALLTGAHWYLWEYMGELASKNLRLLLAKTHLQVNPEFRLTKECQEVESQLSSVMTQDIRQMREFMVHYYGGFPREFFQVLMLLGSLILLSWQLTLLFLGIIFPLGFVIRSIGKRIRRRAQDVLRHQAELTEWLEQRLMGIETIKHFGTEELEANNFVEFNRSLSRRFAKAIATKVRTSPLIELFATVAFVFVLIYSLESIQNKTLSGSVFFSFFSTLALLSQSASKLGRYYNSNKEGTVAVGRIKKVLKTFLDHKEQPHDLGFTYAKGPLNHPKNPESTVSCENLTFFYPGRSDPALSEITWDFMPGQIYCLRGPSGSGKSTLFKTLLGILRPNDTPEKPMIGWSKSIQNHPYPISYMPQRFVAFNAPVIDHVVYPKVPRAEDQDCVLECLNKVGLFDFVTSLPGGIHAVLGSEGHQLSGGQLQRILLARLWYHKSPLILVDEGTSALDPEIERVIHEFLRDLARRGSTIILIAHRLTQIAFADVVLTLEKGRLNLTA